MVLEKNCLSSFCIQDTSHDSRISNLIDTPSLILHFLTLLAFELCLGFRVRSISGHHSQHLYKQMFPPKWKGNEYTLSTKSPLFAILIFYNYQPSWRIVRERNRIDCRNSALKSFQCYIKSPRLIFPSMSPIVTFLWPGQRACMRS
jgi:hypothetical protein